ncbi:MAG: hypothetical protein AB4042_15545 [Leptolyngbyaceae cyanobacterium]
MPQILIHLGGDRSLKQRDRHPPFGDILSMDAHTNLYETTIGVKLFRRSRSGAASHFNSATPNSKYQSYA